jgi:hypothetical protein
MICESHNSVLGHQYCAWGMNVGPRFQTPCFRILDLRCPGDLIPYLISNKVVDHNSTEPIIPAGILVNPGRTRVLALHVNNHRYKASRSNSASAGFQRARDMTGVRVIQSSSSKEAHIRILAQESHTSPSDYHSQQSSIFPGSNVLTRGSGLPCLYSYVGGSMWGTPLFFSEATVCFGEFCGRGLGSHLGRVNSRSGGMQCFMSCRSFPGFALPT